MNKIIQHTHQILSKLKTIHWKSLIKKKSKDPIFWARFSAYAIPLTFLLYVLYINFLPFDYRETFIINVGSPDDTKTSEFYLEPSKSLSERFTTPSGVTLRFLNGSATVVFKPKAVLTDAEITVSTEDEGIFIIPPVINFDPATIDWDYSWDFTKEVPFDLTNQNAFIFDGGTYFNGKDARIELPNSADKFEDGAFTVYVEWEPRDSENNTQQIVGHYNWRIFQNKDNVSFTVGRMNDRQGPAYSLNYPVTEEFFNKKHSAVAVYNPSTNGSIEFFVDGNSAGKTDFGTDKIWKDYGNNNITFGKSVHGNANYFNGYLYKIYLTEKNIFSPTSKINFEMTNNDPISISLMSLASTTLTEIKLYVIQK